MTQTVTDENGQSHYFPDDATPQEMNAALDSAMPKSLGQAALDFVPHQAGLLSNAAVKGATALPTMMANIPAFIANQSRHGANWATGTPQFSPDVPYVNPYGEGADIIFGPNGQPQNAAERLEQDIIKPIAGIAAGGAAAGNTALGLKVPTGLGKGMPMQYASGVTGGAAGGATREMGGSPNEQIAASMLGGMVPSAGTFGINLGKQMLRGGDSNIPAMQSNINDFSQAGITPSMGQATGGRLAQGFESLLGKLPGSSGMMAKFGQKQQEGMGNAADQIADSLNPNATPETAGRAIKSGIEESFLPSQRAIQGALYNKLDSYIPENTQVPVPNTTSTVSKLAAPIPGMPALSNTPLIRNNAIGSVDKALTSDLGGTPAQPSPILNSSGQPFMTPAVPASGTMPYTALKQLRSGVGSQITEPSLVSDIPKSQLKQVYGAASQDMQAAAKAVSPEAENTANQANAFTKSLHDETDIMNPIINQSTPEQIYQSALSGSKTGGTKLGLIMRSLPNDARETVAAMALKDLVKANASQQGAEGGAFSGTTFMTRWNQLSPEAKQALFNDDSVGPTNAAAIRNLAGVSGIIKEGTKILANPSGTAPAAAHIATAAEFLGSLLSGNFGDAATLGGGLGTTRLLANMMTNPRYVQGAANPKWSYMPNIIGAGQAGANAGN